MAYRTISPDPSIEIGTVFDKLTVRQYLGLHKGKELYLCICECGNKLKTYKHLLLNGRRTACMNHKYEDVKVKVDDVIHEPSIYIPYDFVEFNNGVFKLNLKGVRFNIGDTIRGLTIKSIKGNTAKVKCTCGNEFYINLNKIFKTIGFDAVCSNTRCKMWGSTGNY